MELDISRGEQVEAEVDAMIRWRHDRRVAEAGERRPLEMWQGSERRYDERRREANRQAWASYHEGQAERHWRTLEDLITRTRRRRPRSSARGRGVSS